MNNKYWEEEIETMPREQLRELQTATVKKTVSIAANSPYYKKVFQEAWHHCRQHPDYRRHT